MVPILMYHNVARPPAGAALPGLYVPAGTFRRQLRLLRLFRYRGISMSEALPYLRGERQGRVVALTFDDGYADTVANALPVLQETGFTATCYVVSGELGGWNRWDEERLKVRKPIMSEAQLKEWVTAGMEVGAHTRTHPRLRGCTDLEGEVAGSRMDLEELTSHAVHQFCYPYGDYDARVLDAVARAGFHAAVSTRRGRAGRAADLLQLPRVLVRGDDYEGRLLLKLLTRYEERRARRQPDVPPFLDR
jgi:peptidoglycan/xylan/chitin deacetylase (PgdA/CDA1 family)